MTAADVAQTVGVSRATVGFVLNDTPGQTISDDTRQRVLNAALHLGYRPNSAARALARGRSDIVLLVLPDWPMDYVLTLFLEEVAAALDDAGYSLVTWSPRAGGHARPLWESLHADLVIGLAPFDDDQLAALHASGITKIYPSPDQYFGRSSHGFTSGARLQVDHLHELGHQRLAHAGTPDPRLASLMRDRIRLVRAQASHHDLALVGERLVGLGDGSADRAVRMWRDMGCTAVVAYNDYVASIVVGAALRAGIAVPGELAVVGHDDSPLARVFVPSLSTVRLDLTAIGREVAASALHELAARPLSPEPEPGTAVMVMRESTGVNIPAVERSARPNTVE